MRRQSALKSKNKWLSAPYILWSAVFIIVPLGMILYYGLTDQTGSFTLDNITAIASAGHAKALRVSLLLSLVSTLVCFLLAYPLAMILAGVQVKRHNFIILVFILPMWMNFLLRTLAWQTLLEKNGVINHVLSFLHLPALRIINTPAAIILGMVYNFLPFMVLPLYKRRPRSGCEPCVHLYPHYSAPLHSGHYQRHYYGIYSGSDHLCDQFASWRRKTAVDR